LDRERDGVGLGRRNADRNIAVERIVRRSLIGDDGRRETQVAQAAEQVGCVADQRDAQRLLLFRCAVRERIACTGSSTITSQ
jgi:hypothetical protein